MTDTHKRDGGSIVNLGLGANMLLAALKTTIGVVGHSPALLADGINSTSDVAYYVVVKIFMRLAGKPPDREHPYGHFQLESIAALVVGAFILTTAVAIFWDAVNRVYDHFMGVSSFGGAEISALWVALFTVVLKIVLTVATRRVGQRTRNVAILALASDHRNDVISASGAAVGIFFGRMGFPFVDPLVGGFVAIMVLRTGIQILQDSSADLMDTVPGDELEVQTRAALQNVPGIQEVEEVHAHRFGPYLVLNVQIGVAGTMTVSAGDAIASQVEDILRRDIRMVAKAYVHYHPARTAARAP
jgi:cation diffusion facilitator family transporter